MIDLRQIRSMARDILLRTSELINSIDQTLSELNLPINEVKRETPFQEQTAHTLQESGYISVIDFINHYPFVGYSTLARWCTDEKSPIRASAIKHKNKWFVPERATYEALKANRVFKNSVARFEKIKQKSLTNES